MKLIALIYSDERLGDAVGRRALAADRALHGDHEGDA